MFLKRQLARTGQELIRGDRTMAFKGLDEVVKELNSADYKNIDDYVIQVATSMGYSEEDIETITARKSRGRVRELGMSEFKENIQAETNKISTEGYKSFDRENHKIVTNRSGDGITISKKGLIGFKIILADELADYLYSMNKEGSLEIMVNEDEFSNTNKILLKVHDGLAKDKNDNWLNYQKSKRSFSGLTALRAIIKDYGSEELKSRWITMFDADVSLEANSYVFTEGNGLVRDSDNDNLFEIDLMSGKGNKQ